MGASECAVSARHEQASNWWCVEESVIQPNLDDMDVSEVACFPFFIYCAVGQ